MSDQAAELRRLVAERTPPPAARYRSIAVTSGKGGVGKTNIALNLGLALADTGNRVALLDADWGLSNTHVLLGLTPSFDLGHVLRSERRLEETLIAAPLGLTLIPGASGVAELANLSGPERDRLLSALGSLNDFADILILDTAPGISDGVMDLAGAADRVLLLTTAEPTSLTDAYAFAKVLLQRRPDAPVELIVNMVSSRAHAVEVAKGFAQVTGRFLGRAIPLGGFVCADARVVEAVRRQAPFFIAEPRSTAANNLRELAKRLAPTGPEGVPPGAGLTENLRNLITRVGAAG